MASSPPRRNRHTFKTLVLLLLLFLLSLFFFSKRALGPTLSAYRDLWFEAPSLSSLVSIPTTDPSPDSTIPVSIVAASPERVETSLQQTVFPTHEIHSEADSEVDGGSRDGELSVEENTSSISENEFISSPVNVGSEAGGVSVGENVKCDLYMGTWVKDDEYPIYEPGSCPFVDEAFSCQSNERRDSEYLKWRWKPDGCDLPRQCGI